MTLESLTPSMLDVLFQASFELELPMQPSDYFTIDGNLPAQVFGQDGSGGQFAVVEVDGKKPVLYADSEGHAGVLAESLPEFFALLIACPEWMNLLKYSGGGKLSEMKRVLPLLETSKEYKIASLKVAKDLGLKPLATPVETLHANIMKYQKSVVVRSDGDVFLPLFGDFVLEDNPFWRKH